jgi:hypothetical protein
MRVLGLLSVAAAAEPVVRLSMTRSGSLALGAKCWGLSPATQYLEGSANEHHTRGPILDALNVLRDLAKLPVEPRVSEQGGCFSPTPSNSTPPGAK